MPTARLKTSSCATCGGGRPRRRRIFSSARQLFSRRSPRRAWRRSTATLWRSTRRRLGKSGKTPWRRPGAPAADAAGSPAACGGEYPSVSRADAGQILGLGAGQGRAAGAGCARPGQGRRLCPRRNRRIPVVGFDEYYTCQGRECSRGNYGDAAHVAFEQCGTRRGAGRRRGPGDSGRRRTSGGGSGLWRGLHPAGGQDRGPRQRLRRGCQASGLWPGGYRHGCGAVRDSDPGG